MLGFDRITFDPNVMGGRACIRGMRITVSLIVNLVANEMSPEEIIESYPYLESEDIRQALQYAATPSSPQCVKHSLKELDDNSPAYNLRMGN